MEIELSQKQRFLIVVIYILIIFILNNLITGVWIPIENGKNLWLFSSIGFFFFTYLSTPYFVPPRDSFATSTTSALLLATIYLDSIPTFKQELNIFRWIWFSIAVFSALSALISLLLHGINKKRNPKLFNLSLISYRLSSYLGRGQIMFSPLVIISLLGFYQGNLSQQLWLTFIWLIIVFLKPIDLLFKLLEIFRDSIKKDELDEIGEILRIDDPGIIRVKLDSHEKWIDKGLCIAHLPDNRQVELLPLFIQLNKEGIIGTGIFNNVSAKVLYKSSIGKIYRSSNQRSSKEFLKELSGDENPAELIGFVIENSEIARILFEITSDIQLEEGWLVYINQRGKKVYYQIINAKTKEEKFEDNPRGTQIVIAEQLGTLDSKMGFRKYGWLPSMNLPVFLPQTNEDIPHESIDEYGDIVIGKVPNSNISIYASFKDLIENHAAILGVTGTGKTELAFDFIRNAISKKIKVLCVDFTGEYKLRLRDLNPTFLGLEPNEALTLHDKLFDVETGDYSAGIQKKALNKFIQDISPKIHTQIEDYLNNNDSFIGIFEIEEIANTKATLRATELYLSFIFSWARKNRKKKQILLVLEEAHTIVPEMSLFRYDKVETDSVVGRMNQIALQGRKYGVGLLLISQRTALVSKTLLSQCNTVFCFTLHDETGINYLGNVFSSDYCSAIPNLKKLQLIAYGKAIKSERPIIIEIPWDEKKKKASEQLDKLFEKK